MMAMVNFMEGYRQSKFRETVNLLGELDSLDPRGMSSISKYNMRSSDEQYKVVSSVKNEYKGTLSPKL